MSMLPLPVSRKFHLAFSLVCALCLVLGSYSFFAFRSIGQARLAWIVCGVTLLIVALCASIGLVLTRAMAPRIEQCSLALERLAAKDLTVEINAEINAGVDLGLGAKPRLGAMMRSAAWVRRLTAPLHRFAA